RRLADRLRRSPSVAPPAVKLTAIGDDPKLRLLNMLARRALPRLARPLARLSSSSTSSPVPANEAPSPTAVIPQAPNYPQTWSTSQRPRPHGMSGPRFEQTAMELQPNPLSAMEMISREPIRVVQGRKAVCDGGGGPLGHPKIFINLDKPGPRPCGGIRFEQAPHHAHEH
ncbi:Lactobacillus shifted protein, partial [Grifola frondosa]